MAGGGGCSLEHPQVIEEDMCFAIETQEGDHEGQGVRIEEVIHVTRTGGEIRLPNSIFQALAASAIRLPL